MRVAVQGQRTRRCVAGRGQAAVAACVATGWCVGLGDAAIGLTVAFACTFLQKEVAKVMSRFGNPTKRA